MAKLTAAQAEVLTKMEEGWEVELWYPVVGYRATWSLQNWSEGFKRGSCKLRLATFAALGGKGFVWHYHESKNIYWEVTPSGRQALKEWRDKE